MRKRAEELPFLEWLETLSDDELHRVVEMLCAEAAELRITRGKITTFSSDDLFKLDAYIPAKFFVN